MAVAVVVEEDALEAAELINLGFRRYKLIHVRRSVGHCLSHKDKKLIVTTMRPCPIGLFG
jgi:hypothetical protein